MTEKLTLPVLRQRWESLLVNLSRSAEQERSTFEQLRSMWNEPHRAYHNLGHLAAVLAHVEILSGHASHPERVQLAAWFHDAIYNSQAPDNEERSAGLAQRTCDRWGLSLEVGQDVARLILLTKSHFADPEDLNGHVLLDADLAILGTSPSEYLQYAQAIRQEYSWVPEEDYRRGRAAVLRGFLDRDTLFFTDQYRSQMESAARINLQEELRRLGGLG